jgi:hypothetical protein
VVRLCEDPAIFQKYKRNSRLALDLTTTDKASLNQKRRQEFLKMRGQFDLEARGIEYFNKEELKKMLHLEVITLEQY